MSFTDAFNQLLLEAKMSQADFARRSGFGTSYVSMMIVGAIFVLLYTT